MRASSADDLRATFFFFNDTATTEIYTLSLHDALPISHRDSHSAAASYAAAADGGQAVEALPDADPRAARARGEKKRSEEHTSELQSLAYLVCRLLLEKKKVNRGIDVHNLHESCRGHQE